MKLLPELGRELILAGAIFSILLNPLLFMALDRLKPWLEAREGTKPPTTAAKRRAASRSKPTNLADHAVLVGFGRVGHWVGEAIERLGVPLLVIDEKDEVIDKLKARGVEAIAGNAITMLQAPTWRRPRRCWWRSPTASRQARSSRRRARPIPACSSWRAPIPMPRRRTFRTTARAPSSRGRTRSPTRWWRAFPPWVPLTLGLLDTVVLADAGDDPHRAEPAASRHPATADVRRGRAGSTAQSRCRILLKQLGYITQGVGKWHMGENKGSLPQNVGYDDYVGFLGVSDMYTEWRDIYFNPEVALSPDRFKMLEQDDFSHNEVHCTPGDKEKCENGKLIELNYIKELDKHWTGYEPLLPRQDEGKQAAVLPLPRDARLPLRQLSVARVGGQVDVRARCTVIAWFRWTTSSGQLVDKLQEVGELENTLILFTSDNGPECEIPPHGRTVFRGCKGSTLGRRRARADVRLLEGHDQRAQVGRAVRFGRHSANRVVAGRRIPARELAKLFPKTTYIDGIDQAAFLVAEDGLSARRSRPYTLNQYFAAMRIDEFKGIMTAEIENGVVQKGDWGGFSGPIFTDSGGGIVFNLYTNPQEDVSVGIRHIPMSVPIIAASGFYLKELIKYPPQFKIGFMSNNPPVYDLLPKIQELHRKNLEQNGVGRPTP